MTALELTSSCVNLNHSYFNGENLTSTETLLKRKRFNPQVLQRKLKKLALTSHSMKEVLEGIFHESDPLYSAMAVRLAAYEGATIENLSPIYTETLFHMLLRGVSSALPGGEEEESYVNLVTLKEGNAQLPNKMAKALGSHLHLNMPLTTVAKNKEGSIELTFQDGLIVTTDILVLALPCSLYEKIAFQDDLISLEKLHNIQNVQYGANSKIMIPFSSPPSKGMLLVNDQTVCFFDQDLSLLTAYYTGKASSFSHETILNTYDQTRPMIEVGFKDACPPFDSSIFAEDKHFIEYNSPVGYSWPNDPYAKGSYSYIAAGQEALLTGMTEEKGEIFRELFAPIEESIYFAGEHASILLDVSGTMEAACESGERVARAILKKQES